MERIVGGKYKLGRKIGRGSFGEIHLEAKPSVKEFVKEIVDLAEPPERQNVESGADRFSDALLKAGWSGEEVADALGFDFRPEKETRPGKKMSPEMAERIGKLAESFYRL
ncbi:hypothetical protein Vadar_025911 [Vaccinium darrowii]|uniref:Uncharacterized protein n=1 Tax=Vaccinium darrowii TaxID=229202 RepID=A0ACB7Z6K1_9ERIC|nr:hypothetical protein Vadar_025911 [Vaccinium darrowii]